MTRVPIIVGEPTGGGVETYGDTFPVLLPTVGWTVHIAARYHERKKARTIAGSRSGQMSVSI